MSGLSRVLMNKGNRSLKNWVVNKLFRGWTAHRANLDFAEKTFNEMWKARVKND